MGQEISQQKHNNLKHQNYTNCNEKYTKHKDLISTSSSISTSASTDDDQLYRQRQKYNLPKQTYEKKKIPKKLSFISTTTTDESQRSSLTSTQSTDSEYDKIAKNKYGLAQHQRKNSQSTDSGIYYSSCHCSSASNYSTTSISSTGSTSGCCSTSVVSNKSNKSAEKQKHYLGHHLYIKSYLDIVEEDEKARSQFKSARPGGIRNYTPKILADSPLSTSAPVSVGFASTQRGKTKEDLWI